jgi:hypothetical protein
MSCTWSPQVSLLLIMTPRHFRPLTSFPIFHFVHEMPGLSVRERHRDGAQGPEILDLGDRDRGPQAAPRWPPWPTSDPPGCWRWDGVNMAK